MNETLNYIVHHNLLIALLLFLTNGKYIYAQIGIGTTSPHESAALELKSNTKGFLPPLLSSEERNAINDGNPAEGLVIFNTDTHCLEWSTGTAWYNLCTHSISTIEDPNHDQPPAGSQFGREFLNGFEDNPYCSSSFISVASCRLVWGAGINDDPTTPNGIEYDWADATDTFGFGIGAPTTTRAIVEIGG